MADPTANDIAQSDELYDKIHRKSWARRNSGMLGGLTHFGIYGAIIGVVAGLLPFVLDALGVPGASVTGSILANVAKQVAIFACTGMFMGMVTGADVGVTAAAGATVIKEVDDRLSAAGLVKAPEVEAKPEKTVPVKLYNWKTGIFYASLAAVVGALAASSKFTASPVALMGFEAGSPAAVAAFAVIFAMIGNYYAVKNSIISNKLNNFYSQVSSGKSPMEALQTQLTPELQKETVPTAELPSAQKSFAADTPKFCLHNIVDHSLDKSAEIIIQ